MPPRRASTPSQQEQQKNQPSNRDSRLTTRLRRCQNQTARTPRTPRATLNRNGGRDHLGILGEIKSGHPGEIIGISIQVLSRARMLPEACRVRTVRFVGSATTMMFGRSAAHLLFSIREARIALSAVPEQLARYLKLLRGRRQLLAGQTQGY